MPSPSLVVTNHAVEDGIPELADSSVDVAVYSTPYFEEDGYNDPLMVATGRLLARVLKPGARAFMVFGQVREAVDRMYQAREGVLDGGVSSGLEAAQTIIWIKSIAMGDWRCEKCGEPGRKLTRGHYTPINSERILNYNFEHIFQFTKGPPSEALPYDRLAVGVPYADEGNLKRGTRGKNGNVHCAGDAVFIPYSTTGSTQKKGHRHAFPAAVARYLLKLANVPAGGLVLDMFSGGGTTAAVARELGLNAFANDRDPTAIDETKAAWARADEFVRKRESPDQKISETKRLPATEEA